MRVLLGSWATDGDGARPQDVVRSAYAEVTRPAPADRPWVLVNMVSTVDGAIADPDGRSGGLSSPTDKALFRSLRDLADVILVGAGTVREEGYGPVRVHDAEGRLARGQHPLPRLAVVSGRAALDPTSRLFEDPAQRPLLVTGTTGMAAIDPALAERVDTVVAGGDRVDLGAALTQIGALGARIVVCEGGPTLNAALHDADAIDELCLTLAPSVVGGTSMRTIAGGAARLAPLELAHVLEDDGMLFLRYVRSDPAG